MKQRKWMNITLLTALLVTSCSPVAYVEKDPAVNFNNYKTYTWVDTRSSQKETSNPTEFAKLMMHNAVDEKLQQAGWKPDNNHPDVLITYDILVEKKTEERNNPVYTQPFSRMYYNPFFNRWAVLYFPSRFIGYETYTVPVREATVTISMMDAKTDKKIWQGWTTESVNSRLLSKNDIQNSVKKIFKKFDVNKNMNGNAPAVASRS